MSKDLTMRVLRAFAPENCEDIFWRMESDVPIFLVNCNDVFWWGCADCEQITENNIDALEQAFADASAASPLGDCWAGLLFCARQRQMRPQGAYYKILDEVMWPLFDACGPERETKLGNPHAQPSAEVAAP